MQKDEIKKQCFGRTLEDVIGAFCPPIAFVFRLKLALVFVLHGDREAL